MERGRGIERNGTYRLTGRGHCQFTDGSWEGEPRVGSHAPPPPHTHLDSILWPGAACAFPCDVARIANYSKGTGAEFATENQIVEAQRGEQGG